MKEYKTNEELLEHLISKNVKVINKVDALEKIEKYTYYSIINSYKTIFKDSNDNYKDNVTFDEIYALYNKALMANQISKIYGIKEYLKESNLDDRVDSATKKRLIEKINKEVEDDYKVHSAITHYKDIKKMPDILLKQILSGATSK